MNYTALASALSVLTGSKWSVVPDRNGKEEVVREDGLTFWFRVGGYGNEGKVAVHFDRPIGRDGRAPTLWMKSPGTGQISNPSINLSLTKSPEQMAKDIVRRMLKESEEVFKLANEAIENERKYFNGREKTLNRLAEICNTQPGRAYQSNELTYEIDPYKGARVEKFGKFGYGKVKVSSEDSVDIELTSVGADVAAEILVAINNIFKSKATNE